MLLLLLVNELLVQDFISLRTVVLVGLLSVGVAIVNLALML